MERGGWDGIEGFSISFIDTPRSDKNAYREVVCTGSYNRKIVLFLLRYDLDTISLFFFNIVGVSIS